jgi:HD-GYP domain-containing protein (c-di-GMP phosphodiesterase class II)
MDNPCTSSGVDPRHSVSASGDSSQAGLGPAELSAVGVEVESLRRQQAYFIEAELQRLREMAMLSRMADGLTLRRGVDQIIQQVCAEARTATGSRDAWFVEPDGEGRLASLYDAQGSRLPPGHLPLEGRDLCRRILTERIDQPLIIPTYAPDAPEGAYLGVSLRTSRHLMGVLVMYHDDLSVIADSERMRLLSSVAHQSAAACENAHLLGSISRMIVDVVVSMALAIESRDPYTGGHVLRVTAYAVLLGERAGLGEADLDRLRLGGMLHDIGKIAVPDAILRKPCRLEPDEFKLMMSHAHVGHQIISQIPQLNPVACVVRHHHERFDGKGYPDGLSGTSIDPLARITAVADTYDAMTSDRPYRKGLSRPIACEELAKNAGTQFDPELVKLFVACTEDDLRHAIDRIQKWRGGEERNATESILSWVNLNRPRWGGAS